MRRFALLVGLLVAVVVVAAFLRQPRLPDVPAASAVKADLVVPILCDGTLEPPPGGELRAPEAALVGEVLAKDGDRVRKDQRLVVLDAPELVEKAREARAEALRLQAERTQSAADLEDAKQEEARRRRDFEADSRLLSEGAVTQAAEEAAERELKRARGRRAAAEERLVTLQKGTDGPSRLELAETSASDLERRVASLTIRAPFEGVVYGLPPKPGEPVSAGSLVAGVVDPARRRVRARVDQPDLPRVALGQRVTVTFDGLPDRRWDGTVTEVSESLRAVGNREVAEVLAEIADPSGVLPPNASVNVQIVAGEKRGVLAIPRSALFRDDERRFVYVLVGGRARRRTVSTGLVGLTLVEVTQGLKEGEQVLLPGTAPLSDGLRVNPVPG